MIFLWRAVFEFKEIMKKVDETDALNYMDNYTRNQRLRMERIETDAKKII